MLVYPLMESLNLLLTSREHAYASSKGGSVQTSRIGYYI